MWSSEFKEQLSAKNYHLKFRLVLGTSQFPGLKLGYWDKPSHIVEITSHNDPRGYAADGSYYTTHGLTQGITFGAQSISARTWAYQMGTLSVEMSNRAASQCLIMKPGCLAKLECSINESAYETIFVGQYMNMSWEGGPTTRLEFQDAMSYLMTRNNESGLFKGTFDRKRSSDHHKWFKKLDDSLTTTTVLVPGATDSTGNAQMSGEGFENQSNDVDEHGFKNNQRLATALSIRDVDILYKDISEGGDGNRFALVSPTSGNKYILRYITSVSTSTSAVLVNSKNDKLFGYGVPTASTSGTGSIVQPVCVIYGNPVCELVNCFYQNGYSEEMVCGLFGDPTTAGSYDLIDFTEIRKVAKAFEGIWQDATGTTNGSPMRSVQTAPKENGFSHLSGLFAKFGVFPRWKNGAYSVGIAAKPLEMKIKGIDTCYIYPEHIASVNWTLCDSSARSVYNQVIFKSSDIDTHAVGATKDTDPRAAPVLNGIEVNHSPVAAGETQAERYGDFWIETQFKPWWSVAPPSRATVVCSGLRYAEVGVGDLAKISMPLREAEIVHGAQHHYYGPSYGRVVESGPDYDLEDKKIMSVVTIRKLVALQIAM